MADRPIGGDPGIGSVDQQRRDARDSLFVLARIRKEDGGEFIGVRVRNVSSGGLMAQVGSGYHTGMRVVVELEGIGSVGGSVAWEEAGRIGVAFDHPVDKVRARKPVGGSDNAHLLHHAADFKRPPLRTR